ncbi:MAG: aspartate carbamoyltransferase regulatory subunit [Clostridia bacterium]|nr:aspartate carbamoyltransferase regulatory subunit [Clostridia bacterium]
MNIDSIKNGIVIDHIKAGKAMNIYRFLKLDELDCSVAIIKNATSRKMGKKDIIKIDTTLDIDIDVLGYIDHNISVNIIQDSKLVKKLHVELPERLTDVIKCENPRCITTVEQEISHIFKLTNREKGIYRCIYCDSLPKNEDR